MEARVRIAGISGWVVVDVVNCSSGELTLTATQALALGNFLVENHPTLYQKMIKETENSQTQNDSRN